MDARRPWPTCLNLASSVRDVIRVAQMAPLPGHDSKCAPSARFVGLIEVVVWGLMFLLPRQARVAVWNERLVTAHVQNGACHHS